MVLNNIHGVGPNQLLWDLGVDNVHSEGEVRRKIAEMDEKFHLVMILEHFEVSISIWIKALRQLKYFLYVSRNP